MKSNALYRLRSTALALSCFALAFGVAKLAEAANSGSGDGTAATETDAVSPVEGVRVGDRFRFGVHELRWDADPNGNRMMDPGEVSRSPDKGRTWTRLADEKVFECTVVARRDIRNDPETGVVYKKVSGRDLTLHVHRREGWKAGDRRPAVMWFHGGAFAVGGPKQFRKFAIHFTKLGLVNIRVAYRLTIADGVPGGGFDAARDARTAIRWVRMKADGLGIDPGRIVVGGDSAGGAIALATCREDLNDPQDDLAVEGRPNFVMGESAWVVMHRPAIEDSTLVWPLLKIDSLPPIWLGYGRQDVGYKAGSDLGGEAFVRALQEKGVRLSTQLVDEGRHGYGFDARFFPGCLESMESFLRKWGCLPERLSKNGHRDHDPGRQIPVR